MENYKKFLNKLDSVLSNISTALFIMVFVILAAEIFCRGVLGFSLLWPVEASRLLAAWAFLLGAAVLFHRNDHLIVDFIIERFSPSKRRLIESFNTVTVIVLMVVLFFAGITSTSSMMNLKFVALGWPMGYQFLSIPVFAFCSILFLIEKIYILIKGGKVNE